MLLRRASPESEIASSKTGIYFRREKRHVHDSGATHHPQVRTFQFLSLEAGWVETLRIGLDVNGPYGWVNRGFRFAIASSVWKASLP